MGHWIPILFDMKVCREATEIGGIWGPAGGVSVSATRPARLRLPPPPIASSPVSEYEAKMTEEKTK